MKFTKERLHYIYADNNKSNRDKLSTLCDNFGVKCLDDEGFKFMEIYSCDGGLSDDFELIDTDEPESTSSFVSSDDIDEMLRAAALEDKKPRIKVEYVRCEFSREWEAVKYYNEEGELFVIDCNGNYSNVNDISGAWYEVVCKNLGSLYRAVHIDIDWRDDAICYFNTTPSLHEDDCLIDLISKSATKQESDAFIKLCHLVSSLNSVN